MKIPVVLKNAANLSSSGELPSPATIPVLRAKRTKKGTSHNQQIGDVAQFKKESAEVTVRNHVLDEETSQAQAPCVLCTECNAASNILEGHSLRITQAHGRNNSRR